MCKRDQNKELVFTHASQLGVQRRLVIFKTMAFLGEQTQLSKEHMVYLLYEV